MKALLEIDEGTSFDEIKKANKKENYFSSTEREELSNFIKKIQKELID